MQGRKRYKKSKSSSPRWSFIKQIFVGLFLLFLLFLLGSAVWYGSRLESLTITEVKVAGGETVDHNVVQSIAETELKGDYYRLVPKRFAWAFPEAIIMEKTKSLERVKDVWLERPDGNTLMVNFTEYRPYALWCPSLKTNDLCVFLDETGYAFSLAPSLIGSSFLRYFNNSEVKVGEQPFTFEFMRDTDYLAREMRKQFNFSITQIEQVGAEEVFYHLSEGGVVKTTLRQSAEDTLNNLSVILFSEDFRHLSAENFSYIDLRFGDKVFVNEEIVDETVATSTPIE